MIEIEVLDRDLLDKLIESVSDETKVWDISDFQTCFCGHMLTIKAFGEDDEGGYLNRIFKESSGGYSELIMPDGWRDAADDPMFDRANAVRVLKDIRDTGSFSW